MNTYELSYEEILENIATEIEAGQTPLSGGGLSGWA